MRPASEVRLAITEVLSADVPTTDFGDPLCGLARRRRAEVTPLRWAWLKLSEQFRLATSSVYVLDEVVDVAGRLMLRASRHEQVVGSS
jgi:hypothetical protein